MTLRDSRRLTGPSLLLDAPGAIIEVEPAQAPEAAVEAWKAHARRMLASVGWEGAELAARMHPGGCSLAFTAPLDALYAATEVNEWAWAAACDEPGTPVLDEAAERLRVLIASERDPAVMALRTAAAAHGVSFLMDDDCVSVGTGAGAVVWTRGAAPSPADVPWGRVRDVPTALVTGSNGKTTTVRLLAALAAGAGRAVGYSSTDGLMVNGRAVASGDYSGPEGARRILRDTAVETAVLEVARGGLLRRGLNVPRADAATVTNVAVDHLGEFGVHDVETIADVKLLVGRALTDGPLVVNADDAVLSARARALGMPITWFGLDHPGASTVRDGWFMLDGERVVPLADVPLTFGGRALYNVENVLAALPLARALGLDLPAMADGLRAFRSSAAENPGRANLFTIDGATVLLDFAHNPHGQRALNVLARALPAQRRLVVVGHAGDRTDEDMRELARAVWELAPDLIVVKEMRRYLRGRAPGEIPALITEALLAAGAPAERIRQAPTEWQAVRAALRWARPGDLLVLPVQADRTRILELLEGLAAS